MRILTPLLLVAALATPSMAAEPLPAGKPAGTKQAISQGEEVYWLLGTGIVSAALIASVMKLGAASSTGTSS